jgi:ABC-2 type transport system ATP-binding protein
MNSAIKVNNLNKKLGKNEILKDVTLNIGQNRTVGIIGPNGAGKTTLVRCILGLYEPSSGTIEILGNNYKENATTIRKCISAVLDNDGLYTGLTAYQNLDFFADIYAVKNKKDKITELLDLVNLKDSMFKKVKDFSYGMTKRLSIARALLHNPNIIIMDEPTNGLDPEGIAMIRYLVKAMSNKSKTIVINSHNLQEVQNICNDIVLIDKGKIIIQSSLEDLELKYNSSNFLEEVFFENTGRRWNDGNKDFM